MKKSTFTALPTWVLVTVLVLLAAPAVSASAGLPVAALPDHTGEYYYGPPLEAGTPLTLQSRFIIPSQGDFDALDGIHLVGLGATADAPPTALSLVWAEDTSGWFPVWGVLLQSDAGLLPTSPAPKSGPAFVPGGQYISVHTVRPEIDHEYSAELSYDPATGQIVVGLVDLTAGTRLFAKTYAGKPVDSSFTPGVGVVGTGSGLQFTRLDTAAYRVPLSVPLDMLITEDGKQNRLTLYRLVNNAELFVRLTADAAGAAGTFVLEATHGDQVTELFAQPGAQLAGETVIALDNGKLPLGDVELQLEYEDETGKRWLLGTKNLLLVAANLSLRYGDLQVADGQLHGVLTVQSEDETLSDVGYELVATIGAPDAKEGQRMTVSTGTLATVGNKQQQIAFSIPVPADRDVFSLVMDMEFDTPVGKISSGNQYHVLIVR